jgi:hypothetical protein
LLAHDISTRRAIYRHFSRIIAMPPDADWEAVSQSEKIYSFCLKDLAEAAAR